MAKQVEKRKMSGEKSGSESETDKGENYEKPVFTCPTCQKKVSYSSNQSRHVKIHTGQKDFHCNLCDFSTCQKERLQDHIRRHFGERPFKCQEPNCSAAFPTSRNLKMHQRVHDKDDKRFLCPACPFKTHAKSYLTQHMKSLHSDSRPFKCPKEYCNYSCKRKIDLKSHSRIHSPEQKIKCPHPKCEFRTKWPKALKIHMESHSPLTEEKRFKCHFCDYSGYHYSLLVIHIHRHHGRTPFACQLCGFKSKQKGYLDQHMKTHANGN